MSKTVTGETWGHVDTVTGSMTGGLEAPVLRIPGLVILCHPDLERVGEVAYLDSSPRHVNLLSRLEPLFASPDGEQRRALMDPRLSRSPLEIELFQGGGVVLQDSLAKLKVFVDGEPLRFRHRCSGPELERGIVLVLADRVTLLLKQLEIQPPDLAKLGLVGESAAIRSVRRQIERIADLEVFCLVRGDSGTGKELVASAIHAGSPRRHGPFVAVNMGALPGNLAAAELFGARKGAFTGADRHREGLFARADGGTLFLDEIGEASTEVQVLLLRTLETGKIRPVGGSAERAVDVRVLAATDADLESAIADGRFRGPLFHRLSGFEIHLPPLRDRLEDLGLLLLYFLDLELETLGEGPRPSRSPKPWLPASVVATLARCHWPGNVRQLRNVARQLLLYNRGEPQLRLPPELAARLVPAPPRVDPRSAGAEPFPTTGGGEEQGVVLVLVLVLDSRALEPRLRSRHDRILRSLLAEYEGQTLPAGPLRLTGERRETTVSLLPDAKSAVGFALEYHQSLGEIRNETGRDLYGRAGIFPLEEPVADPRAAESFRERRVAEALADRARPGQTLLDLRTFEAARPGSGSDHPLADPIVQWRRHGELELEAVEETLEVCEVGLEGEAPLQPPRSPPEPPREEPAKPHPSYRNPSEVDEGEMLAALRDHGFRIQPAANALGVSRTSLYALIERSPRVRKARDLSQEEIERTSARHGGDLDAMAEALEVSRKGLRRRMTQLGLD